MQDVGVNRDLSPFPSKINALIFGGSKIRTRFVTKVEGCVRYKQAHCRSQTKMRAERDAWAPIRRLQAWSLVLLILALPLSSRAAEPLEIVILGDSLVAGYGLPAEDGFVPQMQSAFTGQPNEIQVQFVNAGVSGDTTAGGLSRLDWSVPATADAVIVSLGANDALRAIPVDVSYKNLQAIIATLQERDLPVLIIGMRAPLNLGARYGQEFDAMYPKLAEQFDVPLYPFFLDGVAAMRHLNQGDGIHPNKEGVAHIVAAMYPTVQQFVASVARQNNTSKP